MEIRKIEIPKSWIFLFKILIGILLILTPMNKVSACCSVGNIRLAPQSNEISQNPLILVEFDRIYTNVRTSKKISFYLVSSKGQEIKLSIIEKNYSFSGDIQFLLKPEEILKLETKLRFEVRGLDTLSNVRWNRMIKDYVNQKTWEVMKNEDNIEPKFLSNINSKYENHFNSSAPGQGVSCTFKYSDDNISTYQRNNRKINEIFVEITDERGQKYFEPVTNSYFGIYHSICGANFEIKRGNEEYEYTFFVRLVDLSGNKSEEIKKVEFRTDKIKKN